MLVRFLFLSSRLSDTYTRCAYAIGISSWKISCWMGSFHQNSSILVSQLALKTIRKYEFVLSQVKMFCGTPSYMAPEIVVKREYKGPSADIWALGVLLYVILTGIFPFKGHTDKELYQKICASDYPKMTGISKSAEELIECMLTVDPDRRMTADEVIHGLF